eukprot:4570093-Prymnesium_polylepis.1
MGAAHQFLRAVAHFVPPVAQRRPARSLGGVRMRALSAAAHGDDFTAFFSTSPAEHRCKPRSRTFANALRVRENRVENFRES